MIGNNLKKREPAPNREEQVRQLENKFEENTQEIANLKPQLTTVPQLPDAISVPSRKGTRDLDNYLHNLRIAVSAQVQTLTILREQHYRERVVDGDVVVSHNGEQYVAMTGRFRIGREDVKADELQNRPDLIEKLLKIEGQQILKKKPQ